MTNNNRGYDPAGKKILVASDDPRLTAFLGYNLPKLGYQVTIINDYEDELLSLLAEERTDIVILDAQMPTLKGIEICLRMRQRSQIPIILVSTWGVPNKMMRGLDLTSDSYLTEPFSINELKELIEKTASQDHSTTTP